MNPSYVFRDAFGVCESSGVLAIGMPQPPILNEQHRPSSQTKRADDHKIPRYHARRSRGLGEEVIGKYDGDRDGEREPEQRLLFVGP